MLTVKILSIEDPPVQIVGYSTRAGESDPALLLARDGQIDREGLTPGTEVTYTLEARHCAGTIDDGRHLACNAPEAPSCPQHTDRWPCARCRGDCDLPRESCREEHAIYLAAFAPDIFKVGVTRSWRLDTRLREQGADRAAHVRTVENGRIARQIEAEIAETVGDRVRVDRKRAGLHRSVDRDAWERLLADFDVREQFAFDYGLELTGQPIAETLLTGSVRGTKGRVLVLQRHGTVYAVDMRDLVGYEVTSTEPDREVQASLGSFD
ncbi:DUF2797 domain-containing protein [Halorhabdus sp. CUG00001]|uniref:DUF2797 domain-containing protein n=1 Tax=Halorhabdus sp. CUG00001 TaxID=2600297 RepID=UPI0018EF27EA|nr:DUF2797 domain-containing protein [Halorhabdus sp. CUG00001]